MDLSIGGAVAFSDQSQGKPQDVSVGHSPRHHSPRLAFAARPSDIDYRLRIALMACSMEPLVGTALVAFSLPVATVP